MRVREHMCVCVGVYVGLLVESVWEGKVRMFLGRDVGVCGRLPSQCD